MATGALADGRSRRQRRDRTGRAWGGLLRPSVGEPLTGHDWAVYAVAAGAAGWHPSHHQRRRRRHGAGAADRRRHRLDPLTGHADTVQAVAAGALADGTPVIISGDRPLRRGHGAGVAVADGTRVSELLRHRRGARGGGRAPPDGTLVIISGGYDRDGAGVADR